jgi:hypothetical protein
VAMGIGAFLFEGPGTFWALVSLCHNHLVFQSAIF